MASKLATTIDLSGPFFRKNPRLTFRQNVQVLMAAVAVEAEADVRAQMRQSDGSRKPIRVLGDHTSDHVIGRTRSLKGKQWAVTAVVSVNNSGFTKAGGTSLMAAGASVERRTHAFRRTTGRMRKAKALNTAELLRGLT